MRRSGSASSRSQEETRFKEEEEEEVGSPMRNRQDASSKNTKPIQYTDQQQAELFRKLDSLKGHVLRGQDSPRASHHHQPPYYNPTYPPPYGMSMYPSPGPRGFPMHQSLLYPGHYPNQMLLPQGHYVDIGPDILDPQQFHDDPRFFPSRYPVSHHPEKIRAFSPHGGGGRHTRRPSEVNSETGGRGYVKMAAGSRRCHPLAGGAPFAACHNCFELLYLPRKKLHLSQEGKKQEKLQCGACSEVFSFSIDHNKLVAVVVNDRPLKNEEPRMQLETKAVSSPSEQHSEGERSSVSPQKEVVVKSVRRRVKDAKVPPPPPPPENSNLLELFEYSNVNRAAALTYGMSQLASETDISYNGYYNNNTEVTSSDDNSRISNASKDETRRGTRKQSSSDYNLSEEATHNNNKTRSSSDDQYDRDRELEVWVNGHLIPEDEVISAEKQAGPVQAGNYWYDYRAGFWGVMGHPCLGIIPPFIEEFSRPMPDNCGAGNTGVFVNARELHERDLELLSSRGLPRGNNRSYIVDISGRVLDGDSGEELKSLGKLAPTIDKVKHGFGMRVPRYLASST